MRGFGICEGGGDLKCACGVFTLMGNSYPAVPKSRLTPRDLGKSLGGDVSKKLAVISVAVLLALVLLLVISEIFVGSPQSTQAASSSYEVLVDADDDPNTPSTREFAGATRYETSLAIAKRYIEAAKEAGTPPTTAIFASGEHLFDAFAAAGLAGTLNAPVILTPPDELLDSAARLISDAGISKVIVLGGLQVVSFKLLSALNKLPEVQKVEHLSSRNRYITAALIAREMGPIGTYCNNGQASVFLVNGDSPPSPYVALVGPISYAMGIPILLTSSQGVPDKTKQVLEDLEIEHVIAVGDLSGVEEELLATGINTVTSISGKNQFATSVSLIEHLKKCTEFTLSDSSVALVSSAALAEGISAAPILGQGLAQNNRVTPILLVSPDSFPADVNDYLLTTNAPTAITAIGGMNAIPHFVAEAAVSAANGLSYDHAAEPAKITEGTQNECRLVGTNNIGGHVDSGDVVHGDDGHTHDDVTVGFPLPSWAAPSVGAFRVAVLYVDFPDASAVNRDFDYHSAQLAKAEQYLELVSYGQLDVQFTPHNVWLRASDNWRTFSRNPGLLSPSLIASEAISLASGEFRFAEGYDAIMVVAPQEFFGGGAADSFVETSGIQFFDIKNFTVVNGLYAPSGDGRNAEWWTIAAHELVHTFGLVDLYPYDGRFVNQPSARLPDSMLWARIEFGIMGFRGFYPISLHDSRFYEDVDPSSNFQTDSGTFINASQFPMEMLSWHRWQLGWVQDSAIACLGLGEIDTTLRLSPIANPNGTSMIVIPTSSFTGTVIESRRAIGYDGRSVRTVTCCEGGTEKIPSTSLEQEGLLIYEVDTSIDTGQRPIAFPFSEPEDQRILSSIPILPVGETASITLADGTKLEISLEADDGRFHTVRVTRS